MLTRIFLLIFVTLSSIGDEAYSQQKSELINRGEKLFQEQGCIACHGPKTTQGPRLENLYGSLVTLDSGKVIKVDEKYLKESILDPQKKVVRGFSAIMPSYRNILKEDDLRAVIVYLKNLKTDTSKTRP